MLDLRVFFCLLGRKGENPTYGELVHYQGIILRIPFAPRPLRDLATFFPACHEWRTSHPRLWTPNNETITMQELAISTDVQEVFPWNGSCTMRWRRVDVGRLDNCVLCDCSKSITIPRHKKL